MNSRQRNKNRENARRLSETARKNRNARHVCENCGEYGGHWHTAPSTLEDLLLGKPFGFWSCTRKLQPGEQ